MNNTPGGKACLSAGTRADPSLEAGSRAGVIFKRFGPRPWHALRLTGPKCGSHPPTPAPKHASSRHKKLFRLFFRATARASSRGLLSSHQSAPPSRMGFPKGVTPFGRRRHAFSLSLSLLQQHNQRTGGYQQASENGLHACRFVQENDGQKNGDRHAELVNGRDF